MIKRILSIQNLGVFDDFNWNRDSTLQDFKEKNIVYGWNYSGKTTLSRIFSSLRDKELHKDYSDAKFKLRLEDNSEIEESSISDFTTRVRVFNKEYIDSKLTWDSKTKLGEPIAFDVGENAEIRKEIEDLKIRIEKASTKKQAHQPAVNSFNEYESWRITEYSKAIRLLVSNNTIPFDKGHFKSILANLREEDLNTYVISDDERIEELKNISNSSNDFSNIDEVSFTPRFEEIKNAVADVLKEEPPKDILIEILENNRSLYNWVQTGLEFEENKETCSFCGNKVEESRITELNNYFSNASKEVRDAISGITDRIQDEIRSVDGLEFPRSKNDFTAKVRDQIEIQIEAFNATKHGYIDALKTLERELERKTDGNIFNQLEMIEIDYDQSNISSWVTDFNELIKSHNSFIENFETERDRARELLKYHLVCDYLKSENYFDKKTKAEKATNWQSLYDRYISSREQLKTEKQDSLKTITKGKDQLNKFIQKFLNRDDIEISVTEEDKFLLLRKERPAINLSEGEKTAIAFSYFLVDFESLGHAEMCKSIVFIDDPISSLDTNHISQVYSLINSYFFRKGLDPDNLDKVVNCFKQFFISTHNFEFFSFLRDSYQLTKKKKTVDAQGNRIQVPNCGLYQIQKIDTENSILKALPKSLQKYKSEYIYLFSLIFEYNEKLENGDDPYDILIPNALRRFLEIYTLMKIPNEPDSVENRISQLVDDVNNFKTLNHFSHFTTFEKATRHDELIMVLPQACKELLLLLEQDNKHFESLKKSIGK